MGYAMERKVAQTELEPEEYETLLAAARKSGLSIKEALRQAALKWATDESGIDPKDPIFDIALGRRKPLEVRLKGEALRRARRASEEVDEAVYGEE
jgi:hypothetical protein